MLKAIRLITRLSRSVLRANILLLILCSFTYAATFSVESETLVRSFERDTDQGDDKNVLPFYEYLSVDADQLKSKHLSFHLYGWGRLDAADNSYYKDQSEAKLLYGYLEYANPYRNRSLRLGRQQVFAGVANDSIDGLRLSSDFGNQFSMTAYAGLPVGLSNTNGRSGDSIFGGRLAHRYGIFSDIGISYKKIDNDHDTASSMLGIDSAFSLPMNIGLYGNSVRNMETDGWAEHNYWLHLHAGSLSIRPYYEMYQYEDYFDVGALTAGPFVALANSDEQLETLGADLSWQQSPSWTFGAKGKHYNYDQNDNSSYLALSLAWTGNFSTQIGGEIGKMSGDAADNDYLQMHLYYYLDQLTSLLWVDFVSGDMLYTSYDKDIYGQDYAYFTSLGSGKTFLDGDLQLKLSADYSKDPYYDNDLRSMLTATYRFETGQ